MCCGDGGGLVDGCGWKRCVWWGGWGNKLSKYFERDEELLGVGADGGDVDADVLAELAERLAEVHLEGLEDQHHVVPVLYKWVWMDGGR